MLVALEVIVGTAISAAITSIIEVLALHRAFSLKIALAVLVVRKGVLVLKLLILLIVSRPLKLVAEVCSRFLLEIAIVLSQKSVFMLVFDMLHYEFGRAESLVANLTHVFVAVENFHVWLVFELARLTLHDFHLFCLVETVLIFCFDQKLILLRIFELFIGAFS